MSKQLIFLSLASMMMAASLTAQTTVYVPADYPTIQGAIHASATGDTIVVSSGYYAENLDLQSKGLIIRSATSAMSTYITGGGNNTLLLFDATPIGTIIDGFTLTGGAGQPSQSSWGYDYYGGGAHASNGAIATIKNCLILRNQVGTGTFGGGAYSGGSGTHLTLEHCVLAYNEAWASGGATLANEFGKITLNRCAIYGNLSTDFLGDQGGIAGANDGDTWVNDCIVWGNSGNQIDAFGAPYNVGVDFYVSYSDVEGGFSGVGNINSDPQFSDVGSNYGFTLSPGSPCWDVGNPASDVDPDGSRADMGAYPLSPTSFNIAGSDLPAGGVATISCNNAEVGSTVYFVFSATGYGVSTYHGVSFRILAPSYLGSVSVGQTGSEAINVSLGNGIGKTFWAQAFEKNVLSGRSTISNVISGQIQ